MYPLWLKCHLKNTVLSICATVMLFTLCLSSAHAMFINEIHYDNAGGDVGEGVELAGVAGEDLSGWSLLFYNGRNGSVYKTYALSGEFTDMQNGMGVLGFMVSGLQNGGADGLALVDGANNVQQFLSYEGSLLATDGAAMGLNSTDIGVAEGAATPVGHSLQLWGSGREYGDFSWVSASSSFAGINAQQWFSAPIQRVSTAVPEPASGVLLLIGLSFLVLGRRGQTTQA